MILPSPIKLSILMDTHVETEMELIYLEAPKLQ